MKRIATLGVAIASVLCIALSVMTPEAFAVKQDAEIIVVESCSPGRILVGGSCVKPTRPPQGGSGHPHGAPDDGGGSGGVDGGGGGGGQTQDCDRPVPTGEFAECNWWAGYFYDGCMDNAASVALWACESQTGIAYLLCLAVELESARDTCETDFYDAQDLCEELYGYPSRYCPNR